MKAKSVFLIFIVLLLSLTGCSNNQDTLKFIHENTGLPNKESVSYEVNIGNLVGGATIVAELWQNGDCTASTPLTLNYETEKLYISYLIDGFGTDGGKKGLNVQIETNAVSGSVLSYFELPPEIYGYSFTAYDDKEVIPVSADKDVILCAMAFDIGAGIRTFDCSSLIDEPERLQEYSCIVIVRATFTAEPIQPQTESEAQNH